MKRESMCGGQILTRLRRRAPGAVRNGVVAKRARRVALAAALVASLGTSSAAGAATTIGPGSIPGLAVDAAGTAYIAWNGTDNVASLRFCRLPRGATTCDASAASSIGTPGTGGARPFVAVSGSRVVVVQHRYGAGVPGFRALYRFTSTNGGGVFGAGQVVGNTFFNEAVVGPGDTMSGVTDANACGMCFQNVLLEGPSPVDLEGRSTVPSALLSSERPYGGAIGLLDAATPLAVFAGLDGSQQFRRYTRSGDLNDQASWTAAADIAQPLAYPKLAGGPGGLFMLGNVGRVVVVRKFNGANFGAAVKIGDAAGVQQHLFQDAGGRLHVVYHRYVSAGMELVHAVSDDGSNWSAGAAAAQDTADGDFTDPRVATAADHIGVAVWSSGRREIRVTAVGPNAPVDPPQVPAVAAKDRTIARLLKGLPVTVQASRAGFVTVTLTVSNTTAKRLKLKSSVLVKKRVRVRANRPVTAKLRPASAVARRLSGHGPLTVSIRAAITVAGKTASKRKALRLR